MTRILAVVLVGLFMLPATAANTPAPSNAETIQHVQQAWQLLDYVATDYAGAVKDGAVIDEAEYAEQVEFAGTVGTLLKQLPASDALPKLQAQADGLVKAVAAKVASKEIADRAHGLAAQLLEAYPIPAAPKQVPNLASGAVLYQQTCAVCHGKTGAGDGPAAAALNPPPIDFQNAARADLRSPLSLYQAISQGVEGTSMVSYAQHFTSEQRWDLAYYVGTLAYAGSDGNGKQAWNTHAGLKAQLSSLAELSQVRVAQLAPAYGLDTSRAVVGWLRAHPETVQQAPQGIALARAKLSASLAAYKGGRHGEAVRLALSSYLDGVEPQEARLDARDHSLRSQIETAMGAYRTQLSRQSALAKVQSSYATADELLERAQEVLGASSDSWVPTFVGSFTIVVREGLEALLVVVALLAFLRRSEKRELAKPVHLGWVLALVAGGITWAVARYFISISGASRELTEGLSALFASVVLLSVGLWMHQKSIGGRWQAYLKHKMDSAMQRRSAWWFLFGLAFITVYREVFETILFYAALWGDGHHVSMLAGLGAGALALAVITWIMLGTSKRLPLGRFFSASSALIAVLAVVLAGKGIAALQEAGWVNVSVLSTPRIEWLGIYPTEQTLIAQGAVILLLVVGYFVNVTRGKRLQAQEST